MSKHNDEVAARKNLNWLHNNDTEQVDKVLDEIKEYQKSLKTRETRRPPVKSEDKTGEKLRLDKELKEEEREKSFLEKSGKNNYTLKENDIETLVSCLILI